MKKLNKAIIKITVKSETITRQSKLWTLCLKTIGCNKIHPKHVIQAYCFLLPILTHSSEKYDLNEDLDICNFLAEVTNKVSQKSKMKLLEMFFPSVPTNW